MLKHIISVPELVYAACLVPLVLYVPKCNYYTTKYKENSFHK